MRDVLVDNLMDLLNALLFRLQRGWIEDGVLKGNRGLV